jgi:hypothetical protein
MNMLAPGRNLLGIPIEGSITGIGERRVRQLPIEELRPMLQAVLHDPDIHSFGWRQYTPYFNDGEPCVFSVDNVWYLTVGDAEDEADHKQWAESYYTWEQEHGYAGSRGFAEVIVENVYSDEDRRWVRRERPNPRYDQARFERCEALSQALYSDKFDLALLSAFGDHAIVTINKNKITVEYYEHE